MSLSNIRAVSPAADPLAAAYAFEVNSIARRDTPLFYPSRSFIYYNARKMWKPEVPKAGELCADEGCTIRMAVKSLQKFGTCLDISWPSRRETIE
jgi:hypothetical protein